MASIVRPDLGPKAKWILAASLVVLALARPPEPEPTRRAVLIGIDDYKSDAFSGLSGSVNDVELMNSVLVGKFDFAPENIEVLRNQQATRTAILRAIEKKLIAPSRQGDVAFLHFSGHGSRMLDTSGDELDGLDETLVPHDSRTEGVFDISDDEINALMSRLSTKTPHVVFVLDSCHSGSAVRAAEVGNTVRQIEPDPRTPPPSPPSAPGYLEAAGDFRLPGSDYVLISGCRANELSNEADFGDRRQGALTYFLARALRAAGTRVTYRDVMEQVRANVTARFRAQNPQLEGTGVDTAVLGVERILPRPYVLVEPVAGDGDRAEVAAGELFGIAPETSLEVYPPGTKSFEKGGASARIRVDEVSALSARAAVVDGRVAPRSRAVLEAVRPPDFSTGIYFENTPLSPTLAKIERALADHESVQVMTGATDAQRRAARAAAQIRVRETSGEIVLEGRDLERLSAIARNEPGLIARVVQEIAHWGRWFAILEIDNPSPTLGLNLSIRRHPKPEEGEPRERWEITGAVRENGEVLPDAVPDGTWITIAARNTSVRNIHLVLLDLTSKGLIQPIYPPADIQDPIPPGKALELTLQAWVPPGSDRVVDWIKAIATTEPIPPAIFRLPPAAYGARSGPTPGDSPLQRFLRSWFQGGTRNLGGGPPPAAVPVDGWVTAQRVLEVERTSAESTAIAVHFDTAEEARRARESFAAGARGGTRHELVEVDGDPNLLEVRTRAPQGRGDTQPAPVPSIGATFEAAYRLREQTGARRAEPMLRQRLPRAPTAPPPGDAGARGGLAPGDDPRAAGDALWHHQVLRVPEAWSDLRASTGATAGAEAAGVVVAHLDTGYLEHPEIWDPSAASPMWADAGYDYYGEDHDAVDDALDDRLLDNPAHGTGSASAIVSPAECQIARDDAKCPTGIGRGARLVPLRVDRSVVQFDTRRMARAIRDAAGDDRSRVKTRADVMSIAMGGVPSWTLWKAVRQAERRGSLIIAAAGNFVQKVVWPARFPSTIAMAAVDAGCRPWVHTSLGTAVDFSAPGVSVWRASVDEKGDFVTGMGTGTTYATSNTAAVAALWIARHKDTEAFEAIRRDGHTTRVFRELVRQTAWQPDAANRPAAADCDAGAGWRPWLYGAGIVDAAALLAQPLAAAGARRSPAVDDLRDLPLWTSIYPEVAGVDVARQDYRRLFGLEPDADLEAVAIYEAEVTYHVATSDAVAEAVDRVALRDDRSDAAYQAVRAALRQRDLSDALRGRLPR